MDLQNRTARLEAALKQWTPLVEKYTRKCAMRASAMSAPFDQEDIRQELHLTLIKCVDAYDESKGVKFITYVHTAFFHEMNRMFRTIDRNAEHGFTVSGDSLLRGEEGDEAVWEHLEDDTLVSALDRIDGEQFLVYLQDKLSDMALVVARLLLDPPPFLEREFQLYTEGLTLVHNEGTRVRRPSEISPSFIAKLLEVEPRRMKKVCDEIANAVTRYRRLS
jgi:hypothetical protein